MELSKSEDLAPKRRVSPMTQMIEELKAAHKDEYGELYTTPEAAIAVGVHIETLRRLIRSDRVKAPSLSGAQGRLIINVFTEADIEELKEYFRKKDQTQDETGAKTIGAAKTDRVR